MSRPLHIACLQTRPMPTMTAAIEEAVPMAEAAARVDKLTGEKAWNWENALADFKVAHARTDFSDAAENLMPEYGWK